MKRVIVIGLDGLEPTIVDRMLQAGELPNFARLRDRGGYARVATTHPAQTPVAWSTFATGTNPGGHGIFDFIRRDPATYLPDLGLNRYEQKSAFLPPKAVNLRRGTPLWETLSEAGIPSVVLRCPCTYAPDPIRGRMLSGMGVPDIRGGLGTPTFYTSAADVPPKDSENVVRVEFGPDRTARTYLIGPRNPKTRSDCRLDVELVLKPGDGAVAVRSAGKPRELLARQGRWSDWLEVKFKMGLLTSVRGMVRFLLVRAGPDFELYASPVNFHPSAPPFPISHPPEYAETLAGSTGLYYTTGMVEDHVGLDNERFDERAFLDQCDEVWSQRERMAFGELDRREEGFFYCLFDTPDRVQHMFWRFHEPDHPAHRGRAPADLAHVIPDVYRRCDSIVGKALEYADEETLLVALSDHGFGSFRRGVHLNSWLHDRGLLALKDGLRPGEEAGDLLRAVDWSRTKAYALGLGSVYLNLAGREAEGTVGPGEVHRVQSEIVSGLTGLCDPQRGEAAVRSVRPRDEVYSGPYATQSPDLVVNFARGYRASWSTALGGVPAGHFEDNTRKWSGDHIVDPALVPGVLLMNRPFRGEGARLVDLAPTVLDALGVPKGPAMEGETLLA